jgi:hypothetical protein
MNCPELYRQYDRQQAVAFFGLLENAKALCGGQWLIMPNAVLCLTNVGKPPRESYIYPASRFCWVADQPYHAANDEWKFLPLEVRAGFKKQRPIHLFVRADSTQPLTYVGELAPTRVWGKRLCNEFGSGNFDLSPTLPCRVWEKLGGPSADEMDIFALDHALHNLDQTKSVHERLTALRELAEYWHGPIGGGEGYAEQQLQGKPIPFPLRWWFQIAGHNDTILSGQNDLLSPGQLTLDQDGRLLFYVENQGVYLWSTILDGDDPPVWGKFNESSKPWTEEGMSLSEFLIGVCLFESIIKAPFGASAACAEQAIVNEISGELTPLPLAPWHWQGYPSRFYAKSGAFMFVCPNGDKHGNPAYSIWIAAKTEQPLAFLKPIVNDQTWEYIAL